MSKSLKKQLLIAALVGAGLLVIAAIVGGTVFYIRLYKPFMRPLNFVLATSRLEESIVNKEPFAPPPSGELTADQVARFAKVEQQIQAAVGAQLVVIKQKRDALQPPDGSEVRNVSIREALRAVSDIGGAFLKAKAARVEALNSVSFSMEEYRWVRERIFAAAGLSFTQLDLESLAALARDGIQNIEAKRLRPGGGTPEANQRLIKAHAARLQDWLALGFFDL